MIDQSKLDQSIQTLLDRVTRAETVGKSAVAALNGFADAVKAAVAADDTIDQATTDRLNGIVDQVSAKLLTSTDELETAVLARTPQAPPDGGTPVGICTPGGLFLWEGIIILLTHAVRRVRVGLPNDHVRTAA